MLRNLWCLLDISSSDTLNAKKAKLLESRAYALLTSAPLGPSPELDTADAETYWLAVRGAVHAAPTTDPALAIVELNVQGEPSVLNKAFHKETHTMKL